MPALSFYLNKDTLDEIKAYAKAKGMSISKVIREAVEHYLQEKKRLASRERVLKTLTEKRPFGGKEAWNALHRGRTKEDACRR